MIKTLPVSPSGHFGLIATFKDQDAADDAAEADGSAKTASQAEGEKKTQTLHNFFSKPKA